MAITPQEALNIIIDDVVPSLKLTQCRTLANLNAMNRVASTTRTTLKWDVDAGGATATAQPVLAEPVANDIDNTVPATIGIGSYKVTHYFPISRVDIQEARSMAPSELKDLLGRHVISGLLSLSRRVNQLIYTGDGTNSSARVIGLMKILDAAKAITPYQYAGIDPAVVTNWKPQVMANGGVGRALTRNLLLDLDQMVGENETGYDMILTSPATAKAYVKVFDGIAGSGSVALDNRDGRGLPNADLGHGGRFYNGYPIIEDPHCPNGVIFFIDSSTVDLFGFNLAVGNTAYTPKQDNVSNNRTIMGLPVAVGELPSMSAALRKFELLTIPQLRITNLKGITAITDLNV